MEFYEIWNYKQAVGIINVLLTVAFTMSIVPRSKRPPANTVAWVLFVAMIPPLGILIYIFLSNRKYKTPRKKKRQKELVLPKEIIFNSLGAPQGQYNIQGNLISSGVDIYKSILGLIESAESTIHLTTFIFARDPVGIDLIKLLEKKAKSGVKVRMLIDSLGAMGTKQPSFRNLKKAGGQMHRFMPFFHLTLRGRSNFRNHRKMLIVDSKEAIIGGVNIAQEYMGATDDPLRWKDLCMSIKGPAVSDIEGIFQQDWKFASRENIQLPPPLEEGDLKDNRMQVIASGPDVPTDPLHDGLLELIYRAEKRIWIGTPYFIPDESLEKALELAAKRGVEVVILVPKKSDHFLADYARGTYLKQLASVGCKILDHPKMLHAKALLFDNHVALVGSANFDMRSLLLNYEICVAQYSPRQILALENWFLNLFKESRNDVFKSGMITDLLEGLGRMLGPVLVAAFITVPSVKQIMSLYNPPPFYSILEHISP